MQPLKAGPLRAAVCASVITATALTLLLVAHLIYQNYNTIGYVPGVEPVLPRPAPRTPAITPGYMELRNGASFCFSNAVFQMLFACRPLIEHIVPGALNGNGQLIAAPQDAKPDVFNSLGRLLAAAYIQNDRDELVAVDKMMVESRVDEWGLDRSRFSDATQWSIRAGFLRGAVRTQPGCGHYARNQHDSHEYYTAMFNMLGDNVKNIMRLNKTTCYACVPDANIEPVAGRSHTGCSTNDEALYTLELPLQDGAMSVSRLMESYFASSYAEYRCDAIDAAPDSDAVAACVHQYRKFRGYINTTQMPRAMVVTLKRFNFANARATKRNDKVTLNAYVGIANPPIADITAARRGDSFAVLNAASQLVPLDINGNVRVAADQQRLAHVYRIAAIVCHSGSAGSGHYIALSRNPVDGNWYRYDDTSVTGVATPVVVSGDGQNFARMLEGLKRSAYMVMYEHQP